MDPHRDRFPLRPFCFRSRSYLLRLTRKLVFGNFLESVWVSAITVFRFDHDFLLIADLQSCQLLFQARNDLSAAMEVGQRLLTNVGIDDFPCIIGERVRSE